MDFELRLGQSREGVSLRWGRASNSHIYLSGQSGRGKSFLLRQLMEQLPPQGVRCIVFDCSGDFRHALQGDVLEDVRNVRKVAKINPFRRIFLDVGYLEENADVAARVTGTVMDAYNFKGQAQPVYLRNAIADFLCEFQGESSISAFVAWLSKDNERVAKMAGTIERLKDLGRALPEDAGGVDWHLDKPGITVLQFNTIPDRAVQVIITELLLADLWSEKLQASGSCPVVALLDECHHFRFRNGSMPMRILREGRKYHFSGWFASQWIDDKTAVAALDQAALRAYFYPGDRNVNSLAKILCSEPARRQQYTQLIRSLEIGDFLYQGKNGTILMARIIDENDSQNLLSPI